MASWLTSAVMAYAGVELLAVVWGFAGALFSLRLTPPERRVDALISVLVSTLAAAALAGFAAGKLGGGKNELIAAAFLCGAGAKPIISDVIGAIRKRINSMGGGGQ
jgi:outer membrane lipoprotein SlyB